MKPEFLEWLVCPEDQAGLDLQRRQTVPSGEIEKGELVCHRCRKVYPVRAGIPRFVSEELAEKIQRTQRTFGYEWTIFSSRYDFLEEQFIEWIRPLTPASFEGKVILDAGCGSGMYTQFLSRYGAKTVIGLDLSRAIDVAKSLNPEPNTHFIQASLLQPPLRRGSFDLVFSKGVIHHLPQPVEGVRSLAALLNEKGSLFVWVYAQEGNGWVLRIVDPIRRHITSRLPLGVERGVSFVVAAALYGVVKGIYAPAARLRQPWVLRLLPYASYLADHARYSFRYMHFNVFDQLSAPVAHYIPRSEVEEWFREHHFKRVTIVRRLGMSWSALGTRAG